MPSAPASILLKRIIYAHTFWGEARRRAHGIRYSASPAIYASRERLLLHRCLMRARCCLFGEKASLRQITDKTIFSPGLGFTRPLCFFELAERILIGGRWRVGHHRALVFFSRIRGKI